MVEVAERGYGMNRRRCFAIFALAAVAYAVFNIFIEPQFTILHNGTGQPAFQLFTALNMQFT
jgi:hypothetical protein